MRSQARLVRILALLGHLCPQPRPDLEKWWPEVAELDRLALHLLAHLLDRLAPLLLACRKEMRASPPAAEASAASGVSEKTNVAPDSRMMSAQSARGTAPRLLGSGCLGLPVFSGFQCHPCLLVSWDSWVFMVPLAVCVVLGFL